MLGQSDKEECEAYKQGNASSQRTSPRHYLHTWHAENKPLRQGGSKKATMEPLVKRKHVFGTSFCSRNTLQSKMTQIKLKKFWRNSSQKVKVITRSLPKVGIVSSGLICFMCCFVYWAWPSQRWSFGKNVRPSQATHEVITAFFWVIAISKTCKIAGSTFAPPAPQENFLSLRLGLLSGLCNYPPLLCSSICRQHQNITPHKAKQMSGPAEARR